MVIGIDVRALQGHTGGVQEYTRHIVRSLLATEKQHQYILFSNSWNGNPPVDFSPRGPFHQTCHVRYPNKLLHASITASHRPRIDDLLYHYTGLRVNLLFYPNIHFVAHTPHIPNVLTVHDLSFHYCPDLYSRKDRLWHSAVRSRHIIEGATHILAVSQWTRHDIMATFGIGDDRITVTPLDCADEFYDHGQSDRKQKSNLILLFGADHLRKNAEGMRAAFHHARVRSGVLKKYTLMLIGRWSGISRELLAAGPQSSIVFRESVSSSERIELYRRAALVVFPSFMEGFGIPLLEAARMRIPLLTANHSSIGEVIGRGAYYVDPYNIGDMSSALIELLSDKSLVASLTDDALAAAQTFSWERTAALTRSVFDRTYV